MGRSTALRRRLPGDGNVPLTDEQEEGDENEKEREGREGEQGRASHPVAQTLRRWLGAALRLLRTNPRARAGAHLVGIGLALMHVQSSMREAGKYGYIWDAWRP